MYISFCLYPHNSRIDLNDDWNENITYQGYDVELCPLVAQCQILRELHFIKKKKKKKVLF